MLLRARGERGALGTRQRSYDLQQLITLRMWNSGLLRLTSLLAVSHLCFQFALLYIFWRKTLALCYTVSQIIFSHFYLELSLAKQGYEQLYRWATQGEWRYKASNQVLALQHSRNAPPTDFCSSSAGDCQQWEKFNGQKQREEQGSRGKREASLWYGRMSLPFVANVSGCSAGRTVV